MDFLEPRGECCCEHSPSKHTPEEYANIAGEYFRVMANILDLKRSESELGYLIGEIIQIFTLKTSVCFARVFLQFLDKICTNDEKMEASFAMQLRPPEVKSILYMYLANNYCFKIKNLILKLIFRYYIDEGFLKEKSTAFELGICLRMSEPDNWKNSTVSYDDKKSLDSSDIGS